MARRRASFWAATALTFLAGCHLIGGLDGYVEGSANDDDGSSSTGGAGATGGAPTSSSTGGAGGQMQNCTDASCQSGNECQSCTCMEGLICTCADVDAGETCSTGYCFNGECVDCIDNVTWTCPEVSMTCDATQCVSAACNDEILNGTETDVDCGGGCAPCPNGKMCLGAGDCATGFCAGTCQNCTMHSDCAPTQYCQDACKPLKQAFDPCDFDYECATGKCNYCLGSACACGY